MKVTQIQMDIKWGDIAKNCEVASELIDSQPGSDLYVLPEMFSTGFATEPEGIADETLQSLNWMKEKAASINAAICGSVATLVNGNDNDNLNDNPNLNEVEYRNRFYFVKPGGEVSYYDKHHLFTYGNEHLRYKAGNERVIVEWRGVRFLLQVCYDLRFPCFSRNISAKQTLPLGGVGRRAPYDAIIYVASWPTSRIDPWRALLKARAIENQCYVLGVDRVGEDSACSYCGGTECIDPYGKIIAACPDNEVCTITNELDMEELNKFRQKFPVLSDAD